MRHNLTLVDGILKVEDKNYPRRIHCRILNKTEIGVRMLRKNDDLKISVVGAGMFGCEYIEYFFARKGGCFDLAVIEGNINKSSINDLTIMSDCRGWGYYSFTQDIENDERMSEDESIETLLGGTDLLFLVVDMKEVILVETLCHLAKVANEIASPVIIVVGFMPLMTAETKEKVHAENLAISLAEHVDIVVPLQPELIEKRFPSRNATATEEEKKREAIRFVIHSIADYTGPMRIGADFSDLRQVFSEKGFAKVGVGISNSPFHPGRLAAEMAMENWLTTEYKECREQSTFINFYGDEAIFPAEFMEANKVLVGNAPEESYNIIGAPICAMSKNEVLVVVIVAGFDLGAMCVERVINESRRVNISSSF